MRVPETNTFCVRLQRSSRKRPESVSMLEEESGRNGLTDALTERKWPQPSRTAKTRGGSRGLYGRRTNKRMKIIPPLPSLLLFLQQETAERSVCTRVCIRMMETQECTRQLVQTGKLCSKTHPTHTHPSLSLPQSSAKVGRNLSPRFQTESSVSLSNLNITKHSLPRTDVYTLHYIRHI